VSWASAVDRTQRDLRHQLRTRRGDAPDEFAGVVEVVLDDHQRPALHARRVDPRHSPLLYRPPYNANASEALMKLVRTSLAAIAIVLALTQPSFTQGQNYPSHLIVFGDSLSDTGNDLIATSGFGLEIPPLGMYYQGRFTNGPVAFEYLWAMLRNAPPVLLPSLGLSALPANGAVSFAFGGTGSGVQTLTPGGFYAPGLLGQVGMFPRLAAQPAAAGQCALRHLDRTE
jgi:hypothetical protein